MLYNRCSDSPYWHDQTFISKMMIVFGYCRLLSHAHKFGIQWRCIKKRNTRDREISVKYSNIMECGWTAMFLASQMCSDPHPPDERICWKWWQQAEHAILFPIPSATCKSAMRTAARFGWAENWHSKIP